MGKAMIRWLLGEAGTGKTTQLYQMLRDTLDSGQKAILLVPEQASFEAEKRAYEELGARRCLSLEVLSFTRLCNLVFRNFGSLAGRALDDCGRILLMSLALGEMQDMLSVYRRHPANPSFVSAMVEMAGELKNAGISPDALAQTVKTLSPGSEKKKLQELSVIYGTYQALIDCKYLDPLDDLMRACSLVEGTGFFRQYAVFCDGFKGFMAGEYRMLERIIADSPQVVFAFTCDGIGDNEGGTGLFSPVKETIRRLIRISSTAGIPVASPLILKQPYRFQGDQLRHLALHLFRPAVPYTEKPDGSVALVQFQNPYEEIEGVARQINLLVRQGWRYRDFAVIARNLESYQTAVETLFGRYGIPYFLDKRVDVENHPITALVLTALEGIKGAPDTQQLLRLAKSPLLGFDPCEVAMLENYCYVWRIEKNQWESSFQNHPDGFGAKMDQETEQRIETIESLRRRLMTPLLRLRQTLEGCDGGTFARGVFSYLEESGAVEALAKVPEQDDITPQVWDGLCSILDRFFLVMREIHLPASRFMELLRLSLQTLEIGLIPQTGDQVLVGVADRIRPQNPKGVFLIGANQGVFPARIEQGGLLSEEDRRLLSQYGLEISETAQQRAVSEKYWAYFAMTSPSHRLYVSYSAATMDSKALYPSVLAEQLLRLFPAVRQTGGFEGKENPFYGVVNEATAFSAYCRELAEPSHTQQRTVLERFLRHSHYQNRLDGLEKLRQEPGYQLDPALAARLFGKTMHISPTRADDFAKCPFAYFVRHGLRLRPRRRAELTPLESGTAIHYVLSQMLRSHPPAQLQSLSKEEMTQEVDQLLEEHLQKQLKREDEAPARFSYLYRRMRATLLFLLEHLGQELGQSRFLPVAFELPIGNAGHSQGQRPVPPLTVTAADGVRVLLEGVVDRVDLLEQDGKKYLRVIDYKSGQKKFDLSDLVYGMSTQMPIYLFALCDAQGEDVIPAGILYMPARAQPVEAQRDEAPEKVASAFERKMRMDGLLLLDDTVLEAMEQNLAGQFIPVKKNKDNRLDTASRAHTATPEELEMLRQFLMKNASEMAQALHHGQIDNLPIFRSGELGCRYCEFAAVCGREPDSKKQRDCPDLSREEIFRRMGQR